MGQRDQIFDKCKELMVFLNGWGYAVNVRSIFNFISHYQGEWPESVVQLEKEYNEWRVACKLLEPNIGRKLNNE